MFEPPPVEPRVGQALINHDHYWHPDPGGTPIGQKDSDADSFSKPKKKKPKIKMKALPKPTNAKVASLFGLCVK